MIHFKNPGQITTVYQGRFAEQILYSGAVPENNSGLLPGEGTGSDLSCTGGQPGIFVVGPRP